MKKPNAYLQQQEIRNQKYLDVGMDTGFQKCWDLIQLCLRDPEVVGKDTFGRERMEKLFSYPGSCSPSDRKETGRHESASGQTGCSAR